MNDIFGHAQKVNDLSKELKLSQQDINNIHAKYQSYANTVYYIPITILAEPQPYKPLRVNFHTGRMYVPDKAKLIKKIRLLIDGNIPMDGFRRRPIFTESIIKVMYYIPTPKAFSRENKYLAELKVLRPIVKPDNDNIEKIIFDAIKNYIIYDDAQMTTDIVEKFYSITPRIEVLIMYNAYPLNGVHSKIIEQRLNAWNQNNFQT